jgi:8-oxo-dGTP pyrophosphatase MutT (NUDIX family)
VTQKHGPWTIKETTEKYRNEFIEVNEDQVVRPDGEPGTYATVKLTPGVSVLPLDAEGYVYLTRQFRYALGAESLEASSGGIEQGEAPDNAARREAREELGIEAEHWQSLGLVHIDTSIIRGPCHLFLAQGLSFTRTEREGTETIKTVKLPLAEALRRVLSSEILHAPSCVLILRAWHTLSPEAS